MAAVPLISVVVPTYQRPDALQRCLRALAAQELPREQYEVIVIDDGSDPAVTIDKDQIRSLDPTLAYQVNQGPAAARNHGARLARGRWLAFTDDDCAPRPSWLCVLLDRLEQNPAALVGGQTLNALANNVYAQASQDLVDFLYDYFPRAVSLRPFLTSNNFAADRKRFLELGGFDASFPFAAAEDRDYSERWTTAGGSLSYAPDAKIEHFQVLTLKQFFLQHHRYGRGAARLARVRALRGDGRPQARTHWLLLADAVSLVQEAFASAGGTNRGADRIVPGDHGDWIRLGRTYRPANIAPRDQN